MVNSKFPITIFGHDECLPVTCNIQAYMYMYMCGHSPVWAFCSTQIWMYMYIRAPQIRQVLTFSPDQCGALSMAVVLFGKHPSSVPVKGSVI